jgi:isoleucyl-tRNA synthetase
MKKIFESLETEKASVVEKGISAYWDEIDILNKSIENRKDNFVFYDGPATANGMPGLHHMLAKLLKDSFCKYKTMRGYRVIRKAGWDTHGLPVELEVEKELGFTSKTDIEKFGIEAFNKKCRESVFRNESAFRDYTKKMGQFIDLDHAYVTYDNDYVETEWWILNEMFKKGLIYEGHKIIPFCTRCGTGLASHEVAQGYQEISTDTVIVPMKKKDEDAYFLVWTTTPWTLLANVALCVNPNEAYIKVESKGYKFILGKGLANKVLGDEYIVLEEYKGTDLEHMEYVQLLPFLNVDKKAFYVTCDNYVTMEDGTGIVHIAPAFGADDYEVGRRYGLPVLNPVGEDGKYTTGPWTGVYVMDANLEVIKYLKENDKLFKKEKMTHNYPHCWRCKTPLLYYAKPSWYIEVTKYKDLMINENNKVNWHPDYIGEKRFGNWLENLNDWAISRNRYWGTPLNIWRCSCGHLESIGSRAELASKSIEKIDENIELHRPYVDNVHIKCPECGSTMNRVPEVMDVWFDSGSMPFAQYHYPFENKELFESQFPADFIAEGIDQTRGWFYVLLAISTFVKGKAPYKNVLVNDMILDKYGQKMSKSRGNGVNPFELIEEYGADTLRWYLPYVSPVWTPTRFDIEGLKEVNSKFFNTLKNTYNFFTIYANTDGVDPRTFDIEYDNLEEIDKWVLSKYNKLVKNVTTSYDEYDLTSVVRSVQDFVNEDLSNWYIRRNRRRFWGSELDNSKKAVYKTTYQVLEGLSRLIAPIVPFVSESIYQKLTGNISVHLADFPGYDEALINNVIETRMDLIKDLISLGRAGREDAKIKVRQPISEVIIDGKYESLIGDLIELIEEELNVKNVTFASDLSIYMNFNVIPNFKVAGPIFGSNIKLFTEALKNLTNEQIVDINNQKAIKLNVADQNYEIKPDMVEVRITSKDGFEANMQNNLFIILNTTLNQDLLDEGIARELVSKVQQMRKSNDFDIIDRIHIYYNGNDEFKRVVNKYNDFIKQETLAEEIIYKESAREQINLNGLDVSLEVSKVR